MNVLLILTIAIGISWAFAILVGHLINNQYDGNCPDCMGEGCEYCNFTGWPDGEEPK